MSSHALVEHALEHCWSCDGNGHNYLDPEAKLLTAPCTHRVCVRCSNRELSRASQVLCPHCQKRFYRHELKTKDANTAYFEKEVQVRREAGRVFSKSLSDFEDMHGEGTLEAHYAWDKYQEKRERIIRWLADGINVKEAKKEMADELASNRADIYKAARKKQEDSRALQAHIRVTRDDRLRRMVVEQSAREKRKRILQEGAKKYAAIPLKTDVAEIAAQLEAEIKRETRDKLRELEAALTDAAAAAQEHDAYTGGAGAAHPRVAQLTLPMVAPPQLIAGAPINMGAAAGSRPAKRSFTLTPAYGERMGGEQSAQAGSSVKAGNKSVKGRDREYRMGHDSKEALRAGGVSKQVLAASRRALAMRALRTWPVGRQSSAGLLRAASAAVASNRSMPSSSKKMRVGEHASAAAGTAGGAATEQTAGGGPDSSYRGKGPTIRLTVGTKRPRPR